MKNGGVKIDTLPRFQMNVQELYHDNKTVNIEYIHAK